MSIRYHHVSDLHPNLTDKWTVNVMAARVWTTYNPNNNRVLSMDLIIVDERVSTPHLSFFYAYNHLIYITLYLTFLLISVYFKSCKYSRESH